MLVHIQFKLSVGFYLIITEKNMHKHPGMFWLSVQLTVQKVVLCRVMKAICPNVIKSSLNFL